MAFVICQPCVDVKDTSCTEVCPSDAIHPTPSEGNFGSVPQLYINPLTCSNCDLCRSACPQGAIYPASQVPSGWQSYIQINAAYYGL